MRYVLVDGTAGALREDDFTAPTHPFRATLTTLGGVQAFPFRWSTDLDGLWGKNVQWEIGGMSLRQIAECKPVDVVITFSHGAQVALYAASEGMRCRLITVNPPVRTDMQAVVAKARPNITRWLNLYGDWKDVWAVLGELGDGHFGWCRQFKEADVNVLVKGPHGAALRDRKFTDSWKGWIAEVLR